MQALDLAKQHFKHHPTAENRELLKAVYLERAGQLRGQGQFGDAATVLEVAINQDPNNLAWLERIAANLLLCGDTTRAGRVLERLPDERRGPLAGPLADASLMDAKSTAGLSPQWLAEREAVRSAFAHYEAGRDEEARTALQPIGLRSPYLEWKMLLRGLQAYQARQDDRAIENWQRLTPTRLPARLAAPFRARIDATFRDAQMPATREHLAQQLARLEGLVPVGSLRRVIALLNPDEYPDTARQLAPMLPMLRQAAPDVADRLQRAFYWEVLRAGPQAISSYRQVFGSPPDDPRFDRIRAMGSEAAGDLNGANASWRDYERGIAQDPQRWPGEDGKLARALIWVRMGQNAARLPTPDEQQRLPEWMRPAADLLRVEPDALECFRRALELVPDSLDAASERLDYLMRLNDVPRAIEACHDLLRHHPDDLDTLLDLADLHQKQGGPGEAVAALQKAVRLKPLDDELRSRLADAHLARAYTHLQASNPEAARADFEAAIKAPTTLVAVRARVAFACALRAAGEGDAAEQHLAAARALNASDFLLGYLQLVEGHLVGMAPAARKPFVTAFNKGIAEKRPFEELLELATFAAGYVARKVEYYGQASHNKKIAEAVLAVPPRGHSEQVLATLARTVPLLKGPTRPLRALFAHAQRTYPRNPEFFVLDAKHRIGDEVPDPNLAGQTRWLLTRADELLKTAPSTPANDAMRAYVSNQLALLRMSDPLFSLGGMLSDPFDAFFGEDDDE